VLGAAPRTGLEDALGAVLGGALTVDGSAASDRLGTSAVADALGVITTDGVEGVGFAGGLCGVLGSVGATGVGTVTPTHAASDITASSTTANRLVSPVVTVRPYHRRSEPGAADPGVALMPSHPCSVVVAAL
jgi:hypothetical protein